MPQIVIKEGPKEIDRRHFNFNDDVEIISIGRNSLNHIPLPDSPIKPKVSEYHAAIIKNKQDKYFVRDLGSTNGIKVNGSMTCRSLLKDGDRIQIGDFLLEFKESSEIKKERKIRLLTKKEEKELFKQTLTTDTLINAETVYDTTYMPHEELQKLLSDLPYHYKKSLKDIYKLVKSTTDIQICLDSAVNAIFTILNIENGYMASIGEDGELKETIIKGFETESYLPLPPSMERRVFREGKIFCSEANKIVGIPLRKENDIFGLIYLEKEARFSNEEIDFLLLIDDYFFKHMNKPREKIEIEYDEHIPHPEMFAWKAKIVGNKKTLEKTKKDIDTVADSNINVLILGDPRTGKQLIYITT